MHLNIENRRLHFRKSGHGPTTVILLHGGPGFTLDCLNIIHTMLAGDQFTVFSYNQSGSALNKNAPFFRTLTEYATELKNIIDQMDSKKIVLFGHSWGGAVLQEFIAHYPDSSVQGIILANTFPSGKSMAQSIKARAKQLPSKFLSQREVLKIAGDVPGYMDLLSKYWYPNHMCRVNPLPEDILSSLAALSMDVLVHFVGADIMDMDGEWLNWDRSKELSTIPYPSLVMSGEFDYGSRSDFDALVSSIPNARQWYESGVSHFPMYEKPVEFREGLMSFLKTL